MLATVLVMNRVFLASLALLLTVVGVVASTRNAGWSLPGSTTGPLATEREKGLESKALSRVNDHRQRVGTVKLETDPVLNLWLRHQAEKGLILDVEALLADAQRQHPHYLRLATLTAFGLTEEGLMQKVEGWQSASENVMSHISIAICPGKLGVGWHAYMVTGQRLPDFSPEALTATDPQATFFDRCSLCGHGQSCEIPRHTRSLSLTCPNCNRIYAVLAADSQGRFRYMNEFLTGYQPPAYFRPTLSRQSELMTIWQAVVRECRYTADTGTADNDAWQTALETQTLGTGDCEDTAILLADWLIARGFQARVAIGRYAERGCHAWVVVRLDKQDYLLESTEGASYARQPPLLAEMGSRYVPELLFDKDAFYTRMDNAETWNGDYWSARKWLRVVPRLREKEVTTAAVTADQ